MPESNVQTPQDITGQNHSTDTVDPQAAEAALRENVIKSVKESAAAQEPIEPPPAAPEEPKKDADGLNTNRMALQIARLEKQMREQKAAYDKKTEEHDTLVSALKDPDKRYELLENQFGATYQDWTERLVAGNKPQRDARDIELEQLKQSIQQMQSQLEQRQETEKEHSQKQSVTAAHQYATKLIEDNKDKYPYLHIMQRGDLLVQEAVKLAQGGVTVDKEKEEEIAAQVEANFVNLIKKDITILSKINAFDNLMAEYGYVKSAQKVPETEQTQRDDKGTRESQTLTNDLSGQPSSGFDYLTASDEELRDHARKRAREAVEAERRRQNS